MSAGVAARVASAATAAASGADAAERGDGRGDRVSGADAAERGDGPAARPVSSGVPRPYSPIERRYSRFRFALSPGVPIPGRTSCSTTIQPL